MVSKAVAKQEAAKLPATEMDVSMFMGTPSGLENVTSQDLLIPRLTVIQTNSPQVTMGKPEFNEKYKAGMILDTGLGEFWTPTIDFLPVHFQKQWIEWHPRESNKGIANIFDNGEIMNQTVEDANGRDVLPNGNYVAETAQIYGLNLSANGRPSYIGMTSTQLKKSRRWLTLATSEEVDDGKGNTFTPPFFYRAYTLGVVPENNAKGSWIGWTIERGLSIPEMGKADMAMASRLYERAKKFKASLDAGEAKADTSTLEAEAMASGSSGGRRGGSADNGQEM